MSNSLQDQLKKSGLVDEKKAKKLARSKRKQEKQARQEGVSLQGERQQQLAQSKADKIARDKQLNQDKNDKAQRKALAAQIKQIIALNTVKNDGDELFNFTDGKKIKQIHISAQQINHLSKGSLAIVKQGDQYLMIAAVVAEKIAARDSSRIIYQAQRSSDVKIEDDPYADYQIPDDLNW